MAPNVTLHFFRNKDLNGTPLLTLTDEHPDFKSLHLSPDLWAVGGGELVVAREIGNILTTDAVAPEAFVRVLVHAYSDTSYFWGFFLNKRNQVVVDPAEDGGEEFRFGGPGPKFYLDRSIMGITDHLGAGWHLDLPNGVWRWKETATAGRILNRILAEDAARPNPALPDLTQSFSATLDSNGDSWSTDIAGSDEYEIPIGRSYLQILFDLEDASGLQSRVNLGTVASPVFELEGFNDGAMGDDVTATSFAAGKVILREGVNIADTSLELEGRSLKKPTHVIVEGKDHTYEFVTKAGFSPGDFVKYDFISYPSTKNLVVLHRVGVRYLLRQERAEKGLTVPILPGASEGSGLYFPKPTGPLWLGNTITLDTAADLTTPTPVDFDNEDALVTGLDLTLGIAGDTADATAKARSWDIKVNLNKERGGNASAPTQGTVTTQTASVCTCTQRTAPECEGTPADSTVVDWDWSPCSNPSYADPLYGGAAANPWGDGSLGDWDAGFCSTDVGPAMESKTWTVVAGQTIEVAITSAKYGAPSGTTTFVIEWYTSGGVNFASTSQVYNRGYLSHEGGDHGTWVTDTHSFLVPATAAYARIKQNSTYLAFLVQHIVVTVPGDPVSSDPHCVDYGTFPHESPYTVPSDYVVARLDDLQDQVSSNGDSIGALQPTSGIGNPTVLRQQVLAGSAALSSEANRIDSPSIFWDYNRQRWGMVYTGYSESGGSPLQASLHLAYSDDLITWEKYAGNPILSGDGSGSDSNGCTGGYIYYESGTYYLFYIGLTANGYEGGTKSLNVATASDPQGTWTRSGSNPLISPSGGSTWYSDAIWHVNIVKVGSTYYAYFNATGTLSGVQRERIGYATATSLTGPWTVNGTHVLAPTGTGTDWDGEWIADPSLYKVGNIWYMAYGGKGTGAQDHGQDGIAWATEAGFPGTWTRFAENPVLMVGSSFDDNHAHKPFIVVTEDGIFHFYTAINANDEWSFGLVVSGAPRHVAAYSGIGTGDEQPYIRKDVLTATGDIIYASAAGTPARLGIGSGGQVLGVSGGLPAWQTASSGSGIGEILISDTPSTPLVFADLIQNEAQDDLVYGDP